MRESVPQRSCAGLTCDAPTALGECHARIGTPALTRWAKLWRAYGARKQFAKYITHTSKTEGGAPGKSELGWLGESVCDLCAYRMLTPPQNSLALF
jgi:hypothetical protein